MAPSQYEAGFTSIAHSEEDIEKTIKAATEVFNQIEPLVCFQPASCCRSQRLLKPVPGAPCRCFLPCCGVLRIDSWMFFQAAAVTPLCQ